MKTETLIGAEDLHLGSGEQAAADSGASFVSEERAALIADVRAAIFTAGVIETRFLKWLAVQLADPGFALERTTKSMRMREIADALGLNRGEEQDERLRASVRYWGERVPTRKYTPSGKPRLELAGSTGRGTEVPGKALIAALKNEIANLADGDERSLVKHFLEVAQRDRTLPSHAGRPFILGTLRQAAITFPKEIPDRLTRAFYRWAWFFNLRPTSQRNEAGEIKTNSGDPRVALAEHIRTLRSNNERLAESERERGSASLGAIEAATRIRHQKFQTPVCQRMIADEIADRGLGPIWKYDEHQVDPLTRERADTLIDWCRSEVAAGRSLPLDPKREGEHDYDEIVRLSGKPGPSLAWHKAYRAALLDIQPIAARWGTVLGARTSFSDFGALFGEMRGRHLSGKSRDVKVSAAKKAIKRVAEFLETAGHLTITSAFGSAFDETIAAMKAKNALGPHPANTLSELRAARDWLAMELGPDGLGKTFHQVLTNAIKASAKTREEICEEADLVKGTLSKWARNAATPAPTSVDQLERLARTLGLDERRLVDLVHPTLSGSLEKRVVPDGMFKHFPPNWRTMSDAQYEEMVVFIQTNLLARGNAFGAAAREVARRRVEATKAAVEDRKPEIEVPDRVRDELGELVGHMTDEMAGALLRRGGQRWTSDYTSKFRVDLLLRFFKWQMTPGVDGGLGRDPDDLTLADIVHPPLVFAYIDHRASALEDVEWQGKKRGRVFTATETDMLHCVKSLVAKDYGFVTQHHDWAGRISADERLLPFQAHIDAAGKLVPDEIEPTDDAEDDIASDEGGGDLAGDGKQASRVGHRSTRVALKTDQPASSKPAPQLIRTSMPIMPPKLVGLSKAQFRSRCRDADLRYRSAAADIEMIASSTRDPMAPIAPIIDAEEPMVLLLRQIALAGLQPRLARTTQEHHLQVRNLLMNRLLAVTTLRSKNIRQITVTGPDAELTKNAEGAWRLRIHWEQFKNFRSSPLFGRKKHREWYEKILPNSHGLYDLIEEYLGETRPWFHSRRRECDAGARHELLLTSEGTAITPSGMWKSVFDWTALHVAHNPYLETGIPNCQPFGPHAYRDIRATDILLNPQTNNPYLEAAMALQTSPQMILDHYGRVKTVKRTAFDDIRYRAAEDKAMASLAL